MKITVLNLGLILLYSGCATVTPTTPDPIVIAATGSANVAVVSAGWTKLNPAQYEGWDGDCPGCDIDAEGCYAWAKSIGARATLLHNAAATISQWKKEVTAAAESVSPNGLLILTLSGHGGQIPDDNGDEADGLDETICMWDGELRDDEFLHLLETLSPGLRILIWSDQCHSEANFMLPSNSTITPRGAAWIDRGESATFNGELIQWAGCQEDRFSYGADSGGLFTASILRHSGKGLSLLQWFDAILVDMLGGDQTPVWVEFGAVSDSFRDLSL